MKTQATFTDWDFATPVWEIDGTNNNGYPYLEWQTFASTSSETIAFDNTSGLTESLILPSRSASLASNRRGVTFTTSSNTSSLKTIVFGIYGNSAGTCIIGLNLYQGSGTGGTLIQSIPPSSYSIVTIASGGTKITWTANPTWSLLPNTQYTVVVVYATGGTQTPRVAVTGLNESSWVENGLTFDNFTDGNTISSLKYYIQLTTVSVTSAPSAPSATTAAVSVFDATSATIGGNITADGGATVSARGVVYSITSTNPNPEIGGTGVINDPNGSGTGSFDESISGLTPNTNYSVKAYATNSAGTSYGGVETFTTSVACSNPTSGGTIGTAQNICSGGDPAAFTSTTPTGHTGTLEYKWQISTTDATTEAGFSDISPSETSETFDPPTGLATTTWYRRLARVTCETTWLKSNVVEITVNQPTKRYVTVVGAGSKNGLDWLNAYDGTQLQTAINESCVNEVWVATGTYKPTIGTDRTISFIMKNGVAIYGGFSGSEENLTDRDWTTNVTILSGDLLGNDGANFTNYADNSYHVIFNNNNGLNSTAILDGFTIMGGNANLTYFDFPKSSGGGMFNFSSSPSVTNCSFIKNRAFIDGGGMYNSSSNLSLTNCSFIGNEASDADGGGMYNKSGSPSLTNCSFFANTALVGGGTCNSSSNATFTNCTFSSNTALNNGGGLCNYNSNLILSNCIVWGNLGGGIQGIYNYQLSVSTVTYSIIQGASIYPGTGNLFADPLFVDAANPAGPDGIHRTADDGISLQASSPAINTGNPTTTIPTTDITGYTRTGVFDIGAMNTRTLAPTLHQAVL
jgi:hypothetical protein